MGNALDTVRLLELLYRNVVVGLVPQPTQIPPKPFAQETLQRVFLDLTHEHTYQQFGFLPDGGAQLVADPDDAVLIQPFLIQVRTPVAMTKELASEKVVSLLRAIAKRLELGTFVNGGIKVIVHVAISPGQDAREFVATNLMRAEEKVAELGPGYFAGGVKYRSIEEARREDNLLIEPFVRDPSYLFIDYDVQRFEPFTDVQDVGNWLDEAYDFIDGPVRRLLEA
jgi:hypothetical protein